MATALSSAKTMEFHKGDQLIIMRANYGYGDQWFFNNFTKGEWSKSYATLVELVSANNMVNVGDITQLKTKLPIVGKEECKFCHGTKQMQLLNSMVNCDQCK